MSHSTGRPKQSKYLFDGVCMIRVVVVCTISSDEIIKQTKIFSAQKSMDHSVSLSCMWI